MSELTYIEDDLVNVKIDGEKDPFVLAWGDPVEKLGTSNGRTRVRVYGRGGTPMTGSVKGKLPTRSEGILKFAMVDVQQGDGMVVETPKGRLLLIDGGDNKLFARYLAARFSGAWPRGLGAAADKPLGVDAIVVTHGDADHFLGLVEIAKSEKHKQTRKRLFLHPHRVYHNGLVKGPGKLKVEEIFGKTVSAGSEKVVVELVDELTEVSAARMNKPFQAWKETLEQWSAEQPVLQRRLALGEKGAFDFLADEGIGVEVLGPIPAKAKVGGETVDGLALLHEPSKTVPMPGAKKAKAYSASHTINGHSVVLRLEYGNVRLLLSGDLNEESMAALLEKAGKKALEAEVVKVPHHGSADFHLPALKAMAGVVWLISSGDESSRKEYIHPRATLMGALGRASRGDESLVFCTELAAFFTYRGQCRSLGKAKGAAAKAFDGFERTSFGIIHVRTDGERVLVFTHSGKVELKEAYRFRVDKQHRVQFEGVKKR